MKSTEIISIKIEQTYISISHERHDDGVCAVLTSQRIYLPQDLVGKSGRAKPNRLAGLLHDAIEKSAITTKEMAIYLGAKIAFFAPYEIESGLKKSGKEKRRIEEEDRILGNLEKEPMIAHYDYSNVNDGLENAAIIVTEEEFVSTLITALEFYGYNVELVSSSLVGYAEAMRPIVRGAGRVVAVDLNKTGMNIVCFEKGEPVSLMAREFADISSNPLVLVPELPRLVDLSVPKTRIVITGFLSNNQELVSELSKLPNVIYCKPLSFELKGAQKSIAFQDMLAGREAMLPGVFTGVGPNPADMRVPSFIENKSRISSGGSKGIVALCIVTILIAFAVALAPMINLFLEQRTHDKYIDTLTSGGNAVVYEKITERRNLTAELSELSTRRELLPEENVSYASLAEELKIALLLDADIKNISFMTGDGLLIDFVTKNVENYEEMKTVIESGGRMQISEPVDREETTEGRTTLTHIQIKVLAGYELQ